MTRVRSRYFRRKIPHIPFIFFVTNSHINQDAKYFPRPSAHTIKLILITSNPFLIKNLGAELNI